MHAKAAAEQCAHVAHCWHSMRQLVTAGDARIPLRSMRTPRATPSSSTVLSGFHSDFRRRQCPPACRVIHQHRRAPSLRVDKSRRHLACRRSNQPTSQALAHPPSNPLLQLIPANPARFRRRKQQPRKHVRPPRRGVEPHHRADATEPRRHHARLRARTPARHGADGRARQIAASDEQGAQGGKGAQCGHPQTACAHEEEDDHVQREWGVSGLVCGVGAVAEDEDAVDEDGQIRSAAAGGVS